MKPTQQRTEEGELPALEVWQDDYGRLSVEMKSPYFRDFGPGRHEYVPASRLTALELELERAREEAKRLRAALEKIANIDHRGNRHHSQWIAFEALSVPPKVRDIGDGQ